MIEKEFEVNNKLGLHARPASALVKTTAQFQSDIRITKGDHEIDGKSIMGLLMLAAGPGTKLKFKVDGVDEEMAVNAIKELFERRFDDEDKD